MSVMLCAVSAVACVGLFGGVPMNLGHIIIRVTNMRQEEPNALSWFSKENSYKELKTVDSTN